MSASNSTAISDLRAQRGERIASRYKLKANGSLWTVPSESDNDPYKVDLEAGRCTCPDSEIRRVKCKHQWAVEITMQRETVKTVEKTTRTVKTARITYKQEWTAYNAAQTHETVIPRMATTVRAIRRPSDQTGVLWLSRSNRRSMR